MLESVLFTNLRFHDTVSRGRLLNRFGKDFESKCNIDAYNRRPLLIRHLQLLTVVFLIFWDKLRCTL